MRCAMINLLASYSQASEKVGLGLDFREVSMGIPGYAP